MAASISCVSTSHPAISQLVYPLRTINARMLTRFLVSGVTIARTSSAWVVQTSRPAVASLRPFQEPRLIASSTSNGVQCILPITIRRQILRSACMRTIRTSGLISFSARCSPAAINCMSRVCKDLTTPLPRTSATLVRQPQARALTPAQVAERLRQRRQLLQQQRQPLRLRQQQHQHRGQRPRRDQRRQRGLVQHLPHVRRYHSHDCGHD